MYDSHCHLAGPEFEGDLEAVVGRARAAGVAGALVIVSAGDEAEAERAARVREIWPEVRVSAGIHPHHAGRHADDFDGAISALDAALGALGAAAVGEAGLDYHYDFSPRDVQQEAFRRQLRVARERDLPIVIHTREADDDTFAILEREGVGVRPVFHCFTGTIEAARRALDMGGWLSFAGIVTFPRATDLRDVARMVPADRVLVETDAPYLAPVPYRGKRNEPAYVARVVEVLAEIRGETVPRIAAQTAENFMRLFGRGSERG